MVCGYICLQENISIERISMDTLLMIYSKCPVSVRNVVVLNIPAFIALGLYVHYTNTKAHTKRKQDSDQPKGNGKRSSEESENDTNQEEKDVVEKNQLHVPEEFHVPKELHVPEEFHVPKELHVPEEFHVPEELHVQIYVPQQTGLEFVHDLMKQLENESDVKISQINSAKDIRKDLPLLLVCFNSSRLGTDALQTVKGVKEYVDYSSTILLVLYHKDEHALPTQSSARVLVGPEFNSLKGIHDIACVTGRGVYPCDMNTKSKTKVIEFLQSIKKNA